MMFGTRSCGCCLQRYSSFCKEFHQCILLPETTLFFPVVLSEMIRQINETNKHCEVLVSCSDKEIYNCMERSSLDCIQAFVIACKLMKLHASLCNCMRAHWYACKLIDMHASSLICMHSGTFWNLLEPSRTFGNLW